MAPSPRVVLGVPCVYCGFLTIKHCRCSPQWSRAAYDYSMMGGSEGRILRKKWCDGTLRSSLQNQWMCVRSSPQPGIIFMFVGGFMCSLWRQMHQTHVKKEKSRNIHQLEKFPGFPWDAHMLPILCPLPLPSGNQVGCSRLCKKYIPLSCTICLHISHLPSVLLILCDNCESECFFNYHASCIAILARDSIEMITLAETIINKILVM